MKSTLLLIPFIFYMMSCSKSNLSQTTSVELTTKMDSISYGMGVNMGASYKKQEFEIDSDLFIKGFLDRYSDDDAILDENEIRQMLRDYYQEVRMNKAENQKLLSEENKKKADLFLSENKNKDGVVTLSSGLQYRVIRQGHGENPNINQNVKVHYTGKKLDGTIFDSSVQKNKPAVFGLRNVIKGWTEALQKMKVGGKWELFIPPALGYGSRGSGGKIGPNELLMFEVELLEIIGN